MILHGNDDVLKVVAGSIIREMLDSGASANNFFPPEASTIKFPEMGERASQWTADFIEFVDDLDIQGLLTQQ